MSFYREPAPKRYAVRVVLKSGYVIDFTCKEFTVNKDSGRIASVSWDELEPKTLWLDLSEVAAILKMGEA